MFQIKFYCFACRRHETVTQSDCIPTEFFVGCLQCQRNVLVKKPLYKYIEWVFCFPGRKNPKILVAVTKIG